MSLEAFEALIAGVFMAAMGVALATLCSYQ